MVLLAQSRAVMFPRSMVFPRVYPCPYPGRAPASARVAARLSDWGAWLDILAAAAEDVDDCIGEEEFGMIGLATEYWIAGIDELLDMVGRE